MTERASELNDAIERVARSLSFPIDRVFPIQSSLWNGVMSFRLRHIVPIPPI
jgi:hypothetical protein